LKEFYTPGKSPVHEIDARVKLAFTLAFIIFLSLTPSGAWPAYILFLTLALSIALLSRVSIGLIQKRALLALPFALATLPLIFTGPPPRVDLPFFQTLGIAYSPEGLVRFVSITLKSWISLQAALLLSATTHISDLLTAFQQLRIPKLFVAIIGLMWRYLFLISDEVTRMLRARSSRSAIVPGSRGGGNVFWRAKVTGGMAGSIFLRSIERSDRVYSAMLSRGYTGVLPASESQPIAKNDRGYLILGLFLLMLLWALGLLTGG